MTEQESQHKETEAFLEEFEPYLREGWKDLDPEQGNSHLSPDPFNLNMEDERSFEELPPHLQSAVIRSVYKVIGLDPLDPNSEVRKYKSFSPERGEIEVTVYRTNRSDEGLFYHEEHFPRDNVTRPVLSLEGDL